MRQFLFSLLMVGSVIAMTGCNDARFPIDKEPRVRVDPRLIGTWKLNNTKERGGYYELAQMNDYEYMAHLYDHSSKLNKGKEEMFFSPVFLSDIENNVFLNVQTSDNSENRYVFFRILNINATASKVTLASIADTTLGRCSSSLEIRRYITEHMYYPSFYKDTQVFYRVR